MMILGIHDGHNASACLYKNGSIVAALQEERITRVKNQRGMPKKAIKWLISWSKINKKDIDHVTVASTHMFPPMSKEQYLELYRKSGSLTSELIKILFHTPVMDIYSKYRRNIRKKQIADMGFDKSKISFIDHHLCHGATAYYGYGEFNEPVLVLTNDGSGDGICASVSIGSNGSLERIATIKNTESIANVYAMITFMMGMVPQEHEYKMMGMAPYADQKRSKEVHSILRSKFVFDSNNPMKWKRANGMRVFNYKYIRNLLELYRFDAVMGGVQLFAEDMIVQWVKNCIRETGIRKIVLAGGIFMNVKANKLILELPEVDDLFVYPSCSDETISIGACISKYANINGVKKMGPVEDLYFGPNYSNKQVLDSIKRYPFKNGVAYKKIKMVERAVARMLVRGEIVACFAGREEFGARALGNRSILADPSRTDAIKVINEMIKNRDFWMPFACSILEDDVDTYLINPKAIRAPYMIMTFDTTEKRSDIVAGLHPYDNTSRPQVVYKRHNSKYYDLIREFKKLSGIGAVLNTSFNLHGYPIVHSPKDALFVFDNSGLKHLAIENILISKT